MGTLCVYLLSCIFNVLSLSNIMIVMMITLPCSNLLSVFEVRFCDWCYSCKGFAAGPVNLLS